MNQHAYSAAIIVITACVAGWTQPAIAAETASLETVTAAVRGAWENVSSLKADITVTARLPIGETRLDLTGGGALEFLRHDEKDKFRQRIATEIAPPHAMEGVTEIICDGDAIEMITVFMNNRHSARVQPDLFKGVMPPGGAALLALLEKDFDLRVLPETRLEDSAVFVLEALPKSAQAGMPDRKAVLYFDKETGLQRKVELYESAAVITATFTLSNITLNPEIDEARFVLSGEAPQEETPATEAAPAEAPAPDAPPQDQP